MKAISAVAMMLLLAAPVLWAGGEGEMELRKQVVIDEQEQGSRLQIQELNLARPSVRRDRLSES